eukprot:7824305-Pyramimonas_sp.AAC.2
MVQDACATELADVVIKQRGACRHCTLIREEAITSRAITASTAPRAMLASRGSRPVTLVEVAASANPSDWSVMRIYPPGHVPFHLSCCQ